MVEIREIVGVDELNSFLNDTPEVIHVVLFDNDREHAPNCVMENLENQPNRKDKNILKNKQLEVRYTSTIDKDAFTVLLENREVCNVLFTDSDSYEEVISSKDLKERLFKLTIVM